MTDLPPLPPLEEVLATLRTLGVSLPLGPVRLDAFGDSPELSRELLALIRSGRKRAGTDLRWSLEAEGETLPRPGDLEVVLDHRNAPAFLTRITKVEVVPFGEVTAEYAATEGEGDRSLAFWREAHWAFFARECARLGRVPSEEMEVVCSEFEVLEVLPPGPTLPPGEAGP